MAVKLTMIRGRRFVMKPTAEQAERFAQFAGVSRLVYNLALEQRRTFWRQYLRAEGRQISWASQSREVTALRSEYSWIASVHTDVTTAALRDVDRAFSAFFSGRSSFPTPRGKRSNVSFQVQGRYTSTRKLNRKWSEIRVPGIGWVRYRDTRAMEGQPKTLTISQRLGHWVLAATCTIDARPAATEGAVGIDRGVANTFALSTGELHQLPASLAAADLKRRRAQRALARKTPGSNRYRGQRYRVAAISSKAAAIRYDWLHKQSTAIARRFGTVAVEALKIANMTASASGTLAAPGTRVAQKRGLNRAILAQGWGIFAQQLAYKLEERGGLLVYVNPAYTSQTCSACGVVDAESRESQAVFRCVACGHEEHADVGAAKEILRRSSAWLDVEGSRRRPAEASTRGVYPPKTEQSGMLIEAQSTPDQGEGQ